MSPRRRLLLALLALLVSMAAFACAGDDTTTTAASSTTEASPASSTTTMSEPAEPDEPEEPDEYAVGRFDRVVVDPTRPTAADPARNLPDRPDRTLPVIVLYPAEGEPTADGAPVQDAPPLDDGFPLVVFSHGVTASGESYLFLLQRWAKAGYVVAAPTFPLSSGPGGQIGAYSEQPDDVHAVTDELLAAADDPADPLHGVIDGGRTAVAGHSLGAITTIGAAFNSCCALDRTDAAIEISGLELPFPEGSYDDWPDVPLLAIHGVVDGTVPVSGSDNLFAKSESPSHYLRFTDAGHTDLLGGPSGQLLTRVSLAFLDHYLGDDPDALDAIDDDVEASGLATYEERNTSASSR